MTTYTNSDPSFMSFLVWKLQKAMASRATQASIGRSRSSVGLVTIVRLLLHVAGFSLLTLAAFEWNMIAGLTVAGLSCFVFSTLVTGRPASAEGTNADLRR